MTKEQGELFNKTKNLVPWVIERFYHTALSHHDKEDMLQDGYIGLVQAIQKRDETKEGFTTYAIFWIRQAIMKGMREDNIIHVPDYAFSVLEDKTDRRYATVYNALNVVSLDAPLIYASNDDVDDDLRSEITSDAEDRLHAHALITELTNRLDFLISTLTEREQLVLEKRFGLHGSEEHTLRETAKILGITSPERVRQIEAKALRKLRHPYRRKHLTGFIEACEEYNEYMRV